MKTAIEFFTEHNNGNAKIGANLAAAEEWAKEHDAIFEWDVSDIDSSDFSDEQPPWSLWECLMYMPCADCPEGMDTNTRICGCTRKSSYHVRQSLGAIDFGRGNDPWGQDYAREVQAQLAYEEMPTDKRSAA